MINNQLRDEIGALNASKGWHDKPRSIAEHCILLHSEVSEIVEDYRNNHPVDQVLYEYTFKDGNTIKDKRKQLTKLGKPCGIPSELADVVIRALDMAYEYEYEIDLNSLEINYHFEFDNFTLCMACMHYLISNLYITDTLGFLNDIIQLCFDVAKENNINLEQQIRDKIEYNKTRPHKHGGKRL